MSDDWPDLPSNSDAKLAEKEKNISECRRGVFNQLAQLEREVAREEGGLADRPEEAPVQTSAVRTPTQAEPPRKGPNVFGQVRSRLNLFGQAHEPRPQEVTGAPTLPSATLEEVQVGELKGASKADVEALQQQVQTLEEQLRSRVAELEKQQKMFLALHQAHDREIRDLRAALAERPVQLVSVAPPAAPPTTASEPAPAVPAQPPPYTSMEAAAPAEPAPETPAEPAKGEEPDQATEEASAEAYEGGVGVEHPNDPWETAEPPADAPKGTSFNLPEDVEKPTELKRHQSSFEDAYRHPELRRSGTFHSAKVTRRGSAIWGLTKSAAEDICEGERSRGRTLSFVAETYSGATIHSTGHISVPVAELWPKIATWVKGTPLEAVLDYLALDLEVEEEVELEQSIWGELLTRHGAPAPRHQPTRTLH